ncbi:MAG: hypothetical protein RIR62_1600, partial [Pseudomonadota bacterium]
LPALPLRAGDAFTAEQVVHDWYRLILELVRHTPTYSPPVASRAFAYVGLTLFEALAARPESGLRSLAGQVTALPPCAALAAGLDPAAVAQGALSRAVASFFGNTGPTGQRAMVAMQARIGERLTAALGAEALAKGQQAGAQVFDHILAYSATDGGAVVENMGFPLTYTPAPDPGAWVPTSLIRQQQAPLLPLWGTNRPFALPSATACALPAPTEYSEDPSSRFYAEAMEVYEAVRNVTPEQEIIARFWSDDPMLSPTPPGHWIFIALDVLELEAAPVERRAEVLAMLGMGLADAFIACWQSKYEFNTIRPVTYIKAHIDKGWEPLLITPPFPEFPSGHSTQSGAAAAVLTHLFGDNYAFEDRTHEDEGFEPRAFASFNDAAEEAGMSRLYGGIHFMPAITEGLAQGRCVGGHIARLTTRKDA